jgi:hypothetical protein
MDFASKMSPDIAMAVMEIAFEMSDVPNKDAVIKKLKEAQAKQDLLTQQKVIADQIKGEKPPAAAPSGPETPEPMEPAGPKSPKEALEMILAGKTWGAVTEIDDATVQKAAQFLLAPKPPAAGVKPASPTKA